MSKLSDIDGKDMWQALSYGRSSPRTEVLLNVDPITNYSALRDGDWKFILGTFQDSVYDQRYHTVGNLSHKTNLDSLMKNCRASAVLKDYYKVKTLVFPERWRSVAKLECGSVRENFKPHGEFYLFNITGDPCELKNLAKKRPEVSDDSHRYCEQFVITGFLSSPLKEGLAW